jgi:hypothetical protein
MHSPPLPIARLAAALFLPACTPPALDSADSAEEVEPWLELTLLPELPTTVDALQVSVAHDEAVTSVSYAWYRDNLLVSGLDGALVAAENTARDQVWRVVVTPERPLATDQPVSAKVTIGNTPPQVLSVHLGEAPDAGSDITAEVETEDADGDAVTLAWSWTLDGEPLAGAWGGSLPAGLALRDQVVGVTVTPSDGTDSGEPVSAEVTVVNSPPSLAAATLGVTSIGTGETLVATTEGWHDADGDPEAYRHAWFVDGTGVGSDSDTFTLDGVAAGSFCWCQVTPFDGIEEGEPVLTEIVLVVEVTP